MHRGKGQGQIQGQGEHGRQGRPLLAAARVVLALAAAALVALFFLPWGSADAAYRDAAAQMPDAWYVEAAGITVADAADLSLVEFARVYGMAGELGLSEMYEIYAPIIYAGLAASVLALVLGVAGKAVPSGICGLLAAAVLDVLRWDFADRGVLPNATHGWGVAAQGFVFVAAVLVVAAIALAVMKHRAKVEQSQLQSH